MDANEYECLSKANASKFRSYYENEYKTLYPIPIKEVIGLDWKFYGSVIISVSTVILASLRTAQMFFFAAGVLYYFEKQEVREFLLRLADMFPGSELLMDVCSLFGIKMANRMVINAAGWMSAPS